MPTACEPDRHELPADQLRRRCPAESLGFSTTADIGPTDRLIGQSRAAQALEFGLGVEVGGYNVFVMGPTGTGKTTYTRSVLERFAATKPTPPDWCYVHNFTRPDEPHAIPLPAGTGPKLKRDIEDLIRALRVKIPEAFASDEYQKQQAELGREFAEKTQAVLRRVEEAAAAKGFAVSGTPSGLATIPLDHNGRPLAPEALESMSQAEQEALAERAAELQEDIAGLLRGIARLESQFRERREALDRKVMIYAVDPLFHQITENYAGNAEVVRHLKEMRRDIIQNYEEFRRQDAAAGGPGGAGAAGAAGLGPGGPEGPGTGGGFGGFGGGGVWGPSRARISGRLPVGDPFFRYQVNVFVSQKGEGAPVVYETNPTYYNLGGKVDYRGEFGQFLTDFTMLSPGALHRANGGYLILNALDVLANPGSWDLLKRSLLTGLIRVESPAERANAAPIVGLRPEPIPLKVKVVMLGSVEAYHLLYQADEDFRKLFKVKAEFDHEMPRTPEAEADYAAFVAGVCRRQGLRAFDRGAVAEIIEYGSRLAENQAKLSLRFNELAEVIYEAEAWSRRRDPGASTAAAAAGAAVVTAEDVKRALEEKEYRSRLIADKLQEMLDQGELLLDLDGAKVGQVNGLAVLDTGDYAFGKPSRITAETYMGSQGVINIERQAFLSGKIHDKGVLILQGHLAARYAQDKPLSLSATICFEQSYAGVDGDSASLAELCALISSLSGVPLKQSVAVTGSVNQKGEVQPVGGLDEKIEGFFEACKKKGLTGEQGVIMPRRSAGRLMLRDEVVEAVRRGLFHVWAVDTVDQALEILTGMPAGQRGPDGLYPEGTVNRRADDKLRGFVQRLAELKDYRTGA